jgi:hypothetical protein
LWPDGDVTGFLNEAEREAAERARLLYDKTTPEVVEIELLPDVREYRLHPKVWDVEAASLQRPGANNDSLWTLCRADEDDMRWSINQRPNLSGWAKYFLVYGDTTGDEGEGKFLILDRKPSEAGGTLHIEVYRYPLVDMEDGEDEPEIAPRHHDGLVHWALHVAYQTRDMEGSASQRAVHHEAEFIKRFGVRDDANVVRKKVRHRAPRVRPLRF